MMLKLMSCLLNMKKTIDVQKLQLLMIKVYKSLNIKTFFSYGNYLQGETLIKT